MAKVYAFPTKRKLPGGMENELKRVAKDYVGVLYATATLFELESDVPSNEEIMELVAVAFAEGICEDIDGLFES